MRRKPWQIEGLLREMVKAGEIKHSITRGWHGVED